MGNIVRWGIVGTGRIAGQFAAALSLIPDARLVAVAARRRQSAESFAAARRPATAHPDAEALAADPAVDIVHIATPPPLHRAHALLMLDAGKAVLIEKPFAMNAAEGTDIVARARARGTFCMEAMRMRFTPGARRLDALVKGGAIGNLRLIEASLGWPHLAVPGAPMFDPARGGALLDLGVYPVSLAVWMFGAAERVVASGVDVEGAGVVGQFAAVLSFPGGRLASVSASLLTLLGNRAILSGTLGRLAVAEPVLCPERLVLTPAAAAPPVAGGPAVVPGPLARAAHHPRLAAARRIAGRWKAHFSSRSYRLSALGDGLAHEAIEAMRALRAGETESPILPLDETLTVLRALDAIGAALGKNNARELE